MKALVWKQYITEPPTGADLNWQNVFLLAFNVGTPSENWATGGESDIGECYKEPTTYWARLPG